MSHDALSLFDADGRRKYLNAEERDRFLASAATFSPEIEALCWVLHFTGCRVSEAMALRARHIDAGENAVIFETLKQRRSGVFRMMPLPGAVVQKLAGGIGADHDADSDVGGDVGGASLFPWHRSTAWAKVAAVMRRAGIAGPQACPRGVRHGFGVAAISAGVPLTLVQRWLGHARLETTAIYLAMIGPEERRFARKIWRMGSCNFERKGLSA